MRTRRGPKVRVVEPVRRRVATTIALTLYLGAAGCGPSVDKAGGAKQQHPVVLHVLSTRGPEEAKPFIDMVAEESKGALQLTLGSGSLLPTGSEPGAIRAVQAGQVDLAIVPVRAFHGVGATSFDALIAPLAVDSMALQQKVLESEMPNQMLGGLKRLGLRGVGVLPGPMRKPAGITRSLRSPSDYRGARIGMNASAVADHALGALGAAPVASQFEGTDISAFDGIEQQVASVAGNHYDGVVRTITGNVNLWPRPLVVFGSAAAMRRLSDRQVSWLQAAAHGSVAVTAQVQMTNDTDSAAALGLRGKAGFITATPAQLTELRSAFAPVDAWLRQDSLTAHFLDQIAALRASGIRPFRAESLGCGGGTGTASPVSPSPSAPVAAASATAFDGTYRMVSTEQEERKSDPTAPPENWGTFIFVFVRGRFVFTQENAKACNWGFGTYIVNGSHVEWTFTDGGGLAPSGAQNKPGEDFTYGWSIYRDTLRLMSSSGISPEPFRDQAWHRLSTTGALTQLSTRCPPPAGALPS